MKLWKNPIEAPQFHQNTTVLCFSPPPSLTLPLASVASRSNMADALQLVIQWQPTPVFLPGESHGQRRLASYSPWGRKSQTLLSD